MFMPENARQSPDFCRVCWNGVEHSFTPTQAAIVATLWQALAAGVPEVHASTLLEEAESEMQECRLGPLFQRNPAWKTMIVPGKRRGAYRLDPNAHLNVEKDEKV